MSGNEQVVPILVGIVLFTFVIAGIVSTLGPVAPLSAADVPDNFNLSGAYDTFTPTYKIASPTNITNSPFDNNVGKRLDFQRSVAPNDHIDGRVVRASAWYVAGSTHNYEYYKDFIGIGTGSIWGNGDFYAISYKTISDKMNSTHDNITDYSFTLSGKGNLTLVVQVHHYANMTADLYANHFNLTLLSAHTVSSVSFWTAIGYLFTFNANWIPTYPTIAYILSAIIDLTIVLCIIRMVW